MESQSRSCHKYLLLQVWCSLLTVTMVVMAALLTTIKSKSSEDGVTLLKPDNPTASPSGIWSQLNTSSSPVNPVPTHLKSVGGSFSYIQLIKSVVDDSWEVTHEYKQSSLVLNNNSIHCLEDSLYFIYAQVTFTQYSKTNNNKYVTLERAERPGKSKRKLVEGIFSHTTEASVWVAKIVRLQKEDRVNINITANFLKDHTFWGALQLH